VVLNNAEFKQLFIFFNFTLIVAVSFLRLRFLMMKAVLPLICLVLA